MRLKANKMKYKELNLNEVELWNKVNKLYEISFPEGERAPLDYFKDLILHHPDNEKLFVYFDDEDNFIGFSFLHVREYGTYISFFAVEVNERRKHHGTEIIKFLIEKFKPGYVCLDIEYPDPSDPSTYEERMKRLKFYEFAGLKRKDIFYSYGGYRFQCLSNKDDITYDEHRSFFTEYVLSTIYKYEKS